MEVYSASLNLWNECNFNCSFCIGARKDIGHKDWENENQLLNKVRHFFSKTGQWEIALIGGEPIINPYLSKFCEGLIDDGHIIAGMTSNASIPFQRIFSAEIIKKFKGLTFSYHPQHEKSPKLDGIFLENIEYALSNNVPVTIVYVLLPERIKKAANEVKRFTITGAKVKISPLYGTYGEKSYPASYERQEIEFINTINHNICSRQLLEYGSRVSTLQECSAGFRSFEIFLESGKIDPCPNQQSFEIFNYLKQEAEDFKQSIYQVPQKCLERNCICGLTYAQKSFLKEHKVDNLDPDVYEEWKKLCMASPQITQYWEEEERKFVAMLKRRTIGKNVFIWGAGIHTSKVYDLMDKNDFPINLIQGIIDSNPNKNGQLFHDIKVFSGEIFFKEKLSHCSDIIISSANYEKEIYEQIVGRVSKADINIIRLYDGSFGKRIPI